MAIKKEPGENLVLGAFSTILADVLGTKFLEKSAYASGILAGQLDRTFADFYAGANNRHVLIEFKRDEGEVKKELDKPLRKKLCEMLTDPTAKLSRSCHFVGWGTQEKKAATRLACYVDYVCALFKCKSCLKAVAPVFDKDFITRFSSGSVGANHTDFSEYIAHLHQIATGARTSSVPFSAVLYTRDNDGFIRGEHFYSLDELQKLTTEAEQKIAKDASSFTKPPRGKTRF